MAYQLEGALLEVCTCNILCPCWVEEDPDNDGTCQSITFDLDGVAGSVKIGDAAQAEIVAYKGATGKESALYDTIFTSIPGAPAYVGKATSYRANVPALNIDINIKDHNAVSGPFRFEG